MQKQLLALALLLSVFIKAEINYVDVDRKIVNCHRAVSHVLHPRLIHFLTGGILDYDPSIKDTNLIKTHIQETEEALNHLLQDCPGVISPEQSNNIRSELLSIRTNWERLLKVCLQEKEEEEAKESAKKETEVKQQTEQN